MKIRLVDVLLLTGLILCGSMLRAMQGESLPLPEQIVVGSGKTHLMDMPENIERISVAAPETAEAVPVNARTLMLNGKAPGETSLVIWLSDGSRKEYDVNVTIAGVRIDTANRQIAGEFGGDVHLTADSGAVYLTGRVKNLFAAQRAEAIAGALGKVVDLLKVDVPEQESQILLKVRFADVDRSKSQALGVNFFGQQGGVPFTVKTGASSATTISSVSSASSAAGTTTGAQFSLSDALNFFLFDSHLNVGATIQDLQNRSVLQILAEPNILAMNGKEASFVSGGEFPYPTLQGGGSGVGQITIQFREFGVRIHFVPHITPRGTIRLHVTPEVSSLDYADALAVSGFTIPALTTRRVDTEIELESGQSFAIAGLLDNRTTESLSRIPGLADIPLLGKLFSSRSVSKSNSELLVIVTPEFVGPVPEGQPLPEIPRPTPFMEGPGILNQPPQNPGTDQLGPAPVQPRRKDLPVQELQKLERDLAGGNSLPAPEPVPAGIGVPGGAGTVGPASQNSTGAAGIPGGQGTVSTSR